MELIDKNNLLGIEKLLDTDVIRKSKEASFILDQVLHDIANTPKIDAFPVRHGRWFFTEYDYYDCSECGESYYNGCDSTEEARHRLTNGDAYPYCPYCGAKMDLV